MKTIKENIKKLQCDIKLKKILDKVTAKQIELINKYFK